MFENDTGYNGKWANPAIVDLLTSYKEGRMEDDYPWLKVQKGYVKEEALYNDDYKKMVCSNMTAAYYREHIDNAYQSIPSANASVRQIWLFIDSVILHEKDTFGMDGDYSSKLDTVPKDTWVAWSKKLQFCTRVVNVTGMSMNSRYYNNMRRFIAYYAYDLTYLTSDTAAGLKEIWLIRSTLGSIAVERESDSNIDRPYYPNSGDNTIEGLTRLTDTVWSSVITIVQAISVGCVLFAGLRYMYASADKKAEIKKTMIYLVVGALFVFATSSVIRFIYSVGNSIVNG